jgi:hypothetical protein
MSPLDFLSPHDLITLRGSADRAVTRPFTGDELVKLKSAPLIKSALTISNRGHPGVCLPLWKNATLFVL